MLREVKQTFKSAPFFADSMLLLAVLGWAISFPVAKLAMNDWGNYKFFFLAGRFWIAFGIFAPIAIKRFSWQAMVSHLRPGAWVGLTLTATFAFQYKAISMGSSGEVAFITALNSVLVPLGMWLVFKKRIARGTWLGLVVATAGAALVEVKGSLAVDRVGVLAFFAAVGIAADLILVDYFMSERAGEVKRYDKIPFLAAQFLVLAIATTFLSFLTELPSNGLPGWSSHAIFGMVFMAVVATAGAFFIQTKYQPSTTPERAALIFTLESPMAGLFGYILLSEAFTPKMVVGAAMIVIGVAYAEVLAARRDKPPSQPTRASSIAEITNLSGLPSFRPLSADFVPVLPMAPIQRPEESLSGDTAPSPAIPEEMQTTALLVAATDQTTPQLELAPLAAANPVQVVLAALKDSRLRVTTDGNLDSRRIRTDLKTF